MTDTHELIYKVMPLHLPKIIKNNQLYTCSEKFRINSNKALSDVWLVYKSDKDNSTWNLTIHTRTDLVNSISPDLYHQFLQNDLETVWEYAFDIELIKRNGGQMSNDIRFEVQGTDITTILEQEQDMIHLTLISDYYMNVSIKNALKSILKLSSDKISSLYKQNIIQSKSKLTNALGKHCVVFVKRNILNYLNQGVNNATQ